MSAIYSRMASLLQPAYSEIAREAYIPAESRSVLDLVERAVDESGVTYLTVEPDGPTLSVRGTKPLDAR